MDDALWVNNNGMVVCLKHGGNYLQSAVESEPTWDVHVTPLDVWMKADSAGSIWDASCEVCSSRPLTVTTTSTQPTADTTAQHNCGLCDAPIEFAGIENGHRTWQCIACDWWHTSQDCCDPQAEEQE